MGAWVGSYVGAWVGNSTMLKVLSSGCTRSSSVVDHDAKSRAEDSGCSATIDDAF